MKKRLTRQKQVLSEGISTFKGFFDAYELHAWTMKRNPKMGMATIYRFLKELEEHGEVHSYLCEQRKIYSRGTKNHVHFTCEHCGNIEHIPLKRVDFLDQVIAGKACHFQIDITGICKECLRRT